MIQHIIGHTPLYVWAILALLVQRGVSASRDRDMSVRKLCIIPLVMTALSLQGIASAFGMDGVAPLAWLAGALAAAALLWRMGAPAGVTADPARGMIRQPGSWTPLALMLSIFCLKYALAVSLAMAPELRHAPLFTLAVCALYGVFSGVFAGRLLRSLAVYHRAGKVAALA
ncbi:DUF6622 family protein [Janthinobacterium sp.]|uniref:DUF6622 family protein n=1 Tax=Janthinobacterium sp. TaxID=1871054 RepID=UPI00293D5924|nr:DUF6622 family protein [Janthinobacterium sp.]